MAAVEFFNNSDAIMNFEHVTMHCGLARSCFKYYLNDLIFNQQATNSSACGRFEQCCLPADTAPIFNPYTNSLMCPGESYPARCLEGFYCPNSTTRLPCPAGHFCREGSQKPVECMVSACRHCRAYGRK